MGFVNFLLLCAGISKEVMDKCPDSEVIKHSSIGASVLFTALLALISSHFAFSLIFENYWTVTAISVFWGLIIFNLDRYIVSTLRKKGSFGLEFLQISPRLVLSMAIALVIAKPLELQIFRTEVEEELYRRFNKVSSEFREDFDQRVVSLDMKKEVLKKELKEYFDLKEQYYQEYRCECDGTCGTGQPGDGLECARKRSKYETFVQEYQSKELDVNQSLNQLEDEKAISYQLFQEEIQRLESNFSFGLLARIKALNNLNSWEVWTVTFLILLIEVAPVLAKLFSPIGPYDELLAIQDSNFKMNYLKHSPDRKNLFDPSFHFNVQEQNLDRKMRHAETERLIAEMYQDLRKELSNQLKK